MALTTTDIFAQPLQIESSAAHRYVPVTIPFSGETTAAALNVKNTQNGDIYPATLREGSLTFVVDSMDAAGKIDAEVVAAEDQPETAKQVLLKKRADEDVIDVTINGSLFTAYHYGTQWRKPFLWPVNTEGGISVTRDYPMDEESTPKPDRDHPHQKSFWTAFGEVNGVDLWGEGSGAGNQRCKNVDFGSGDAFGWIRSENVWEDQDGNPLIEEIREYRFYNTPENARLFDVFVSFKAGWGDVLFSDTKEGGIVSARMRPDICRKNAVITNALGDVDEARTWGKPAPWCDFSGDVPEVGWRGLTIFDNPTNLRYPSCWHVRSYGLMGANAFGYSYFNEKKYNQGLIPENGDYTIKSGESLDFNYRIYVHSGTVEEAKVAQHFEDYINPPKAAFTK